jgi:hypothetical protein
LRGQKGLCPLKIPRNAPLYVLTQIKKDLQDIQNQRYIGTLCPKEREREIERKSESKNKSKSER